MFTTFGLVEKLAMSFEVRGRCETPSYFLSICEFSLLFFCAIFDGIEWHSGFQPLMTFNGSAVQRSA